MGPVCRKFKIPNYQNGSAYLTSHRACYVDNAEPRKYSVAIELPDIERYGYQAGFLRSSPKITFYLKSNSHLSELRGYTDVPTITSGGPTPNLPSSPAIRPLLTLSTWICAICSFANPVPSNYIPQVSPASLVPPCLACGIKPQSNVLDKAILSRLQNTPSNTLLPPGKDSPAHSSPGSPATAPAEVLPYPAEISSSTCRRCTFNNHPSLTSCEICGERLISPGLPEELLLGAERAVSPGPLLIGGLSIGTNGSVNGIECLKMSFRNGGAQAFHEKLKGAMMQRKWLLVDAPAVPKPNQHDEGSSGLDEDKGGKGKIVGVAGLERQNITLRKENERTIGGAFEDLEALMSRAKEMVQLAESFATRLASQQSTLGLPSSADRESWSLLQSSSTALGLGTDKSTELYHTELARQTAEFLTAIPTSHNIPPAERKSILRKEGGVITLVDLWATYNRSRAGTDLISPSDFAKAASLYPKLNLPVRLRRFKSGLLVIQDASQTDEKTIKKIVDWMRSLNLGVIMEDGSIVSNAIGDSRWGVGITAVEAAERFGWSIGVATEELEVAEEKGVLCREVLGSGKGVRWWINYFSRLMERGK